MAWPPAALPTNRTNATPQQNTHPADHNALALAINDTVGKVQANDAILSGTGSGQMGRLGRVYGGVINGGAVTPGGGFRVTATLSVPAGGMYLVVYLVWIQSTAPINAQIKLFGTTSTTVAYRVPAETAVSACVSALSAGGDLSVNVENLGGTQIDTYSDPANHRFFAVGLVTP